MIKPKVKVYQSKLLAKVILASLFLFAGKASAESELSVGFGYFNLDAKTSSGSTTIANLGYLKFLYSIDISNNVVFWPGYSLYFLGGANSDLGFGLDLELAYYPLSNASRFNSKSGHGQWTSYETIRPFVSFSFDQRSYQSVQSAYAGMGFALGADYQVSRSIFYFGKLAFLSLSGPLDSSISELQIQGGIGSFIGD